MTAPIPWNSMAADFVANSRRWFPNLHENDWDAVVHMTLGLAGEVGELLDAMCQEHPDAATIGLELADVCIYTCDIGGLRHLDLEAPHTLDMAPARTPTDAIFILAGFVANIVKKANRSDEPLGYLGRADIAPQLRTWLAAILQLAHVFAYMCDIDLAASIDAKVAICEERWG